MSVVNACCAEIMAGQEKKEKKDALKKSKEPKPTKPKQPKAPRLSRMLAQERVSSDGNAAQGIGLNGEILVQPPKNAHHKIQGIVFGALTLFLLVSLLTYHPDDPASLSDMGATQNIAGVVGAMFASVLFRFFGYVAYAFPLMTLLICIDRFHPAPRFVNYGNLAGITIGLLCLCGLLSLPTLGTATKFSPGGFFGAALASFLLGYLKVFGSITVLITGLIIAGFLLKVYFFQHLLIVAQDTPTAPVIANEPPTARVPEIITPQAVSTAEKEKQPPQPKPRRSLLNPFKRSASKDQAGQEELSFDHGQVHEYQLPPPSLLNSPPTTEKLQAGMKQGLLTNSKLLEEKLRDFGIEGQVVGVMPGPVITRYEVQPAPGIKVSRIVNLSDDLALGLKAESIRIVAPVPGKDVVGIEVPNKTRETVYLRDLIETATFLNHPSRLVLAVGKDIGGHPYFADLAKMPHLLIAGATGSGKSVCLNSLICSILFHATPEEVRFIMVDPKMLELGVYDNIPHLLIPVVKDPELASNALNWATEEMTRRYGVLAQKGVRNIAQYNETIREVQKSKAAEAPKTAETLLPYIVIIVDELADLMMVASGVEKPIMRLAQMARAVGIHLILATQRPSVDVITGVIKANFPARMSFRVSSKVDSRTILDANGSELLLGDGDMLFLQPGTSFLRRLHGAFLTEKEIKRITTFLKKMGKPTYDQAVLQYHLPGDDPDEDDAELYRKAAHVVVKSGEASISLLRRSFKIGHSKAARIIDMMERDGVVSTFKGSRPREILVTAAQLDERFKHEGNG